MGFEVDNGGSVQVVECNDSSSKALSPVSIASSGHRRSKSDPNNRVKEENLNDFHEAFDHRNLGMGHMGGERQVQRKPMSDNEIQSSLKQEILQLEKRLQDQFATRCALEKALGYRSAMVDTSNDHSMPKTTKELIREISVLELEVMYLEQYLLSLYRKAFDQQIFASSPSSEEKKKPPLVSQPKLFQEVCGLNFPHKQANIKDLSTQAVLSRKPTAIPSPEDSTPGSSEKLMAPGVLWRQSTFSHNSVCTPMSPQAESVDKALRSCQSQPLSFLEHGQNAASHVISLAEYLGTSISDHVPNTPNGLSEDLVRCIGSIFCKLSEPPLISPGVTSSPASSCSSMSPVSPQYMADAWSPGCRKGSFDSRLENPFHLEGLKEFSGPYNEMIEVPSICTDTERLGSVEVMLQNFKSLANRLENVEVRNMKKEEKLAFWINIHNALVMHAYVEYGVPQNFLKRSSILLKAACKTGGRLINADTIQGSILGCRTLCPGQWIRTLLLPKSKLKAGKEWQAYAIENPEPLLHFALCSGSHSDPAVRIYTPKRVFQQLETAKEEYIRATVSIRKEQKILLPKSLESFTRESSLSPGDLLGMIQQYLPEALRMAMQRCQSGKSPKCIEWVPHNFSFRYLLSRELESVLIDK